MQAESLAARVEAACRAEPALGQLWRAETAITEAVASVGLEGVRIDAADLLPRVALNARSAAAGWLDGMSRGSETRDAERALLALRILKSPGNPFSDPVGCIRRLERLAASRTPGRAVEQAWASERPNEDTDETAAEGRAAEGSQAPEPIVSDQAILALFSTLRDSDPPILGAVRMAAGYRALCPGGEPMVERAIFLTVEGGLRHQAWFGLKGARRAKEADDLTDDEKLPLRGLSEAVAANWVAAPSAALTRGTFRLWNPSSPHGVRQLLSGLVESLRLDLGRLISLREWLERAEMAGQGRTERSRLTKAARLFAARPVMNSADLAGQLGCTQRGAINLAEELVGLGLLRELTQRRAARIWATPEIARLLAPPAVTKRLQRVQDLSRAAPTPASSINTGGSALEPIDRGSVERDWVESRARHEARLEKIYRDLDLALRRAEDLLRPRD